MSATQAIKPACRAQARGKWTEQSLRLFRAIVRWTIAAYLAAVVVTLGLGLDPMIGLAG